MIILVQNAGVFSCKEPIYYVKKILMCVKYYLENVYSLLCYIIMFFLLNSIALLYVLSFSYLFKIFILIFVTKKN